MSAIVGLLYEDALRSSKAEIERLRAIIRGFTGHFVTLEMARDALERKPDRDDFSRENDPFAGDLDEQSTSRTEKGRADQ